VVGTLSTPPSSGGSSGAVGSGANAPALSKVYGSSIAIPNPTQSTSLPTFSVQWYSQDKTACYRLKDWTVTGTSYVKDSLEDVVCGDNRLFYLVNTTALKTLEVRWIEWGWV
jgi:hypothetical protein